MFLSFIGSPIFIAGILVSVILTAIANLVCVLIRLVRGRDVPDIVLKNNDYGFFVDFKHLLFYWQNYETGGFVFSKTKFISLAVFLLFFAVAMISLSRATLVTSALFAFIFMFPVFLCGWLIHKNSYSNKKLSPIAAQSLSSNIEIEHTVSGVDEFRKYRIQLDKLSCDFDLKNVNVRSLIEKRFEPPQITYTRFISAIDHCEKIFLSERESVENILNLATEDSERVDFEINSKMNTLKLIISKLDDLGNELLLNAGKSKSSEEVNIVLEDMEELIDSVKDYE